MPSSRELRVKPSPIRADIRDMGIRHRDYTAIVAVLATCLLTGCATRMTAQELDTSLHRAIEGVPARQAIRRFVPIYAQTPMEAWVVRSEAKTAPESSQQSRELANGFALGQRRRVDYFIGGPYAELSDQLVVNGLRMNEGRALPGLRIVLVSPAAPTPDLIRAAKARRARLEYRALH